MKKNIVFLILFIISFAICTFLNMHNIDIPYLNGVYKKVKVDVIFKNNKTSNVFFDNRKINSGIKIDENHIQYFEFKNHLIKKITFEKPENIEKAMVFIGNDIQFIDNFNSTINIDNNKNLLDKFSIIILSFFYNFHFYLIPYLFLFLFLYNFKGKISHKTVFYSILLLGLIFRITQINNIPFWDDEIYVLQATANYSPLSALFNDPGNPPLYFILFKIYKSIIQNPELYRYSSVIIGLLFNFCFFYYAKFLFGSKKALITLGIVSINIILIYFSQEIRCYMLLMLLCIINSFLLFKFNKNNTKKYTISTILLLYTHFYASFFVLFNFLYGLSIFYKNKEKLKSFIVSNLISFLSFLPLLIYKKTSLISDFNSWIKPPEFQQIQLAINVFCSNIIFVCLFILMCIFIYKKTNKQFIKLIISYNFLAIIFIFICSISFSYLIKPIFSYRYFYVVFPSYLILVSTIIFYNYSFKVKNVFAFLLFLCFTIFSRVNYQNLFCNHNIYLNFIKKDINKEKNNYVFMSDTTKGYKEFKLDNTEMIYLPINAGIKSVDIEKYNLKKPFNAYVLNLYLEENVLKNANKVELYKTPLGVFSKIEYK